MKLTLHVVLVMTVIAGMALANNADVTAEQSDGQKITLDDLQWLTGRWVGEAFGGECEEVWSRPTGGSMIGTFKLIMNGQASMYEFMMITVEEGVPVLRLKHFNSDLTGWEEKDKFITFPYKAQGDNEVIFDGLTYKREGENLTITVVTGDGEGGEHTNIIKCKRESL